MKLYKIGWGKHHPPAAVGAFVAEAAREYARHPEFGRILAGTMATQLDKFDSKQV